MSNIKVIASDLDGTFFYPKKRIRLVSTRNVKMVKLFRQKGGHFLIVTSRNRAMREKLVRRLKGKVDMVGCNGAFIISNGHLIREVTIDNGKLKALYADLCRDYDFMFPMLFTRDYNLLLPKNKKTPLFQIYSLYQMRLGESYIIDTDLFNYEMENGKIYKFMLFVGVFKKGREKAKQLNKVLREKYPDFEFAWVGEAIEVTPKGCTKSDGIQVYLDYNHFSHDNVLVVGDSGNDISMFEAFPEHSYCMAHAPATVKKRAKHVIKNFGDLKDELYPSVDNKPKKKEERDEK